MNSEKAFVTCMFVIGIWCTVNIQCIQSAYSAYMETDIRNETILHSSYDPVSRPEALTRVNIGLNILAIDELDLKGQKLTMAGWLTFEWEDGRIHWNATEKDDIEYIFTKPKHIWKPELIVDNALEDLGVIKNDDLLLRVKYNGHIEWEPPILLITHCKIDITYYPYDQQRCAVELASWTYSTEEVKLEQLFDTINLEDFEVHGEWKLTHTEIEDKNLTEHLSDGTIRSYPQIYFWVHLRRRTQFYNLNVMMPIILTSLMVAMVFIVPIGSGEKVSYVLMVFLSLAVLLTIVTDSLPRTSITVSVLGLYLGMVLIFSAVASLLTILILILFHKDGQPKQTSFVVTLSVCAAKMMCWSIPALQLKESLTNNLVSPMADSITMETISAICSDFDDDIIEKKDKIDIGSCSIASSDVAIHVTWKDIAQVLDIFCFFSFTVLTVLMNVAFVITLAMGG